MDFEKLYNIAINPVGLSGNAAKKYTRQVNEHLTWIYRTKTGRILLAAIKYHNWPVSIEPYTGGNCNAAGSWKRVGTNYSGKVNYSPDTFSLHGACPATTTAENRGLLWDEILFHELVHVFRGISKKWSQKPLSGGLLRYTDTEEFTAVLTTNIYLSDKSNRIKSGLRGSHRKFDSLESEFSKPFQFFSTSTVTFSLVKQFCLDNPGFTKRVAVDLADAEFNPLADYYASPELAEKRSKQAVGRDVVGVLRHLGEVLKLIKKS